MLSKGRWKAKHYAVFVLSYLFGAVILGLTACLCDSALEIFIFLPLVFIIRYANQVWFSNSSGEMGIEVENHVSFQPRFFLLNSSLTLV